MGASALSDSAVACHPGLMGSAYEASSASIGDMPLEKSDTSFHGEDWMGCTMHAPHRRRRTPRVRFPSFAFSSFVPIGSFGEFPHGYILTLIVYGTTGALSGGGDFASRASLTMSAYYFRLARGPLSRDVSCRKRWGLYLLLPRGDFFSSWETRLPSDKPRRPCLPSRTDG